jgi:hypothetical protein
VGTASFGEVWTSGNTDYYQLLSPFTSDSFAYEVQDSTGASATGTITVTASTTNTAACNF